MAEREEGEDRGSGTRVGGDGVCIMAAQGWKLSVSFGSGAGSQKLVSSPGKLWSMAEAWMENGGV